MLAVALAAALAEAAHERCPEAPLRAYSDEKQGL